MLNRSTVCCRSRWRGTLLIRLAGVLALGCGGTAAQPSPHNATQGDAGWLAPPPPKLGAVRPRVRYTTRRGASLPLVEVASQLRTTDPPHESKPLEPELPPTSHVEAVADPIRQTSFGPGRAPQPTLSLEGLSNKDNEAGLGFAVYPPDTVGDVGPNHFVQWVNLSLAVFDKAGHMLAGPLPGNAPWAGFGGPCETNNDGDVLVVYDPLADRWVFSQFAITQDGIQCFAVSQTPDPLGAYHLYEYRASEAGLNDYPKLGVWPHGYFLSFNEFRANGGSYSYHSPVVMAFDREAMLLGLEAPSVRFEVKDPTGAETYFTLQPANLEGRVPPPEGSPGYFVMAFDDELWRPNAPALDADSYKMWALHVTWTDPGAASLVGPVAIPTPEFNAQICPSEPCINQRGSTRRLDSLGIFAMYRLSYRAFASHEALVINHTVNVDAAGLAGIRWAEIRDPQAPHVYQTGTYAPEDGNHRWMGSVAMDVAGNIALGYSVSGPETFPSLRYAGRLRDDPLGMLAQAEAELVAGGGAQTGSSRWGDYAALGVDESDGCTFWFTSEYYPEQSSHTWHTRIGSFAFESCAAENTGTLEGTVASQAGAPLSGAVIRAGAITTVSNAEGFYRLRLPEASYDVSASAWGFKEDTATGIAILEGDTAHQDFVLEPHDSVLVHGFVHDGSEAGWPLYARLEFNTPGGPSSVVFSEPSSGYYHLELLTGLPYRVKATALVPGYDDEERPLTPGPSDTMVNFALEVNVGTCSAPGYHRKEVALLMEDFEERFPPAGWSVTHQSSNCIGVPEWTNETARVNLTGGSGRFAIADSDACGAGSSMDTVLTTPAFDLSDLGTNAGLVVGIDHDLYTLGTTVAAVELWNGTSFITLGSLNRDVRGPASWELGSQAANGIRDAQLRFHYTSIGWEWWWEIDNVRVHKATCTYQPGALIFGHVYDALSGEPLNGAQILRNGEVVTHSTATPQDPARDDGFYSLFAPSPVVLGASLLGYADAEQEVVAQINGVTQVDLHLDAGMLLATPETLNLRIEVGESGAQALSLDNVGTHEAAFSVVALAAPPAARNEGPLAKHGRRTSPKRLHAQTAEYIRVPFVPPQVPLLGAGNVVASFPTELQGGWGIGYNLLENDVWVGDVAALGGDDTLVRFLEEGIQAGERIDMSSYGSIFGADIAYNARTGMLWQINVGGDNCIHEIDPMALHVTGRRICPAFGTSERGLAYDPVSDTYFAGSWNDGVINQFTPEGTILSSVNVGLDISGLAYNAATGHLFALTNSMPPQLDVYVIEVVPGFRVLGGFELYEAGFPAFADYAQAGLTLDCQGRLWAVDQKSQRVLVADSGEETTCMLNPEYLSIEPNAGVVPPGGTSQVELVLDATTLGAGLKQIQLLITTDTPYAVPAVPAYLLVAFHDVGEGHAADASIHAMAEAGITAGCGGGNFCPELSIMRRQSAVWVLKGLLGATHQPPPATGLVFDDVSPESYGAAWIEEFAALGISSGCAPKAFCPDASVARQDAAVMLLRARLGPDYVPPPAEGVFVDVPDSPYRPFVEDAARRGIIEGCDAHNFCPEIAITRAQMAVAVVQAFGIANPLP